MMKNIISREGSLVILRDRKGKLWLTRRHKPRHDNRRRRSTHVKHYPIRRILEKGDWIFTCSMKPLQFDRIIPVEREGFKMSDKEWEEFKDDHFCTIEGSHHSKKACSCTPISDEYAKFFIDHKLWEIFDKVNFDWDKYEEDVKTICKIFKIKYEGI